MERSQSSTSSNTTDVNPGKRKEYMSAGLYCQDAEPPSERALVNKVLDSRVPVKRGPGRPRKSQPPPADGNMTFHHYRSTTEWYTSLRRSTSLSYLTTSCGRVRRVPWTARNVPLRIGSFAAVRVIVSHDGHR
jgi:hypothetical protein